MSEPFFTGRSERRPSISFEALSPGALGDVGREPFATLAAEYGFEVVGSRAGTVATVFFKNADPWPAEGRTEFPDRYFLVGREEDIWRSEWQDDPGELMAVFQLPSDSPLGNYEAWLARLFDSLTGAPFDAAPRREIEILLELLNNEILENAKLLARLNEQERVHDQLRAQYDALLAECHATIVNAKRARPITKAIIGVLTTAGLVVNLATGGIVISEKFSDDPAVQRVLVQCVKVDESLARPDR